MVLAPTRQPAAVMSFENGKVNQIVRLGKRARYIILPLAIGGGRAPVKLDIGKCRLSSPKPAVDGHIAYVREQRINDIIIKIRKYPARIANSNIRLIHPGYIHQLAQQRDGHLRRVINPVFIIIPLLERAGVSVVAHRIVYLYGNLLASGVTNDTFAPADVEIPENTLPRRRIRTFAGQTAHRS